VIHGSIPQQHNLRWIAGDNNPYKVRNSESKLEDYNKILRFWGTIWSVQ